MTGREDASEAAGDSDTRVAAPLAGSRFAYFDTNILSEVAKDQSLWPGLSDFLWQEDLTLAIGYQLAELSDAEFLHRPLGDLVNSVPAAYVKPSDIVLEEEVNAHPQRRTDTLFFYPAQHIRRLLSKTEMKDARKEQRRLASQLPSRHDLLKSNFPSPRGEKYTPSEAEEFANAQVMEQLARSHFHFMTQFRDGLESFHGEVFLSIRVVSFVVFYKYYLGRRVPDDRSDLADLGNLPVVPYCELFVTERDLCQVLRQIKDHHDVLDSTDIENLDFLERLR